LTEWDSDSDDTRYTSELNVMLDLVVEMQDKPFGKIVPNLS
jgi:hypothetical protein